MAPKNITLVFGLTIAITYLILRELTLTPNGLTLWIVLFGTATITTATYWYSPLPNGDGEDPDFGDWGWTK